MFLFRCIYTHTHTRECRMQNRKKKTKTRRIEWKKTVPFSMERHRTFQHIFDGSDDDDNNAHRAKRRIRTINCEKEHADEKKNCSFFKSFPPWTSAVHCTVCDRLGAQRTSHMFDDSLFDGCCCVRTHSGIRKFQCQPSGPAIASSIFPYCYMPDGDLYLFSFIRFSLVSCPFFSVLFIWTVAYFFHWNLMHIAHSPTKRKRCTCARGCLLRTANPHFTIWDEHRNSIGRQLTTPGRNYLPFRATVLKNVHCSMHRVLFLFKNGTVAIDAFAVRITCLLLEGRLTTHSYPRNGFHSFRDFVDISLPKLQCFVCRPTVI